MNMKEYRSSILFGFPDPMLTNANVNGIFGCLAKHIVTLHGTSIGNSFYHLLCSLIAKVNKHGKQNGRAAHTLFLICIYLPRESRVS